MKKIIGLIVFGMFAGTAHAQINYDYVGIAFERTTLDLGFRDVDGNGVNVGGSFSIRPNVFGFADFNYASFDANVDVNSYLLGVGYHTNGPVQYVAKASVARVNVNSGLSDGRDNIYIIELGGRGRTGERYELEGFLQYTDGGSEVSGELGVKGSLRYHFKSKLSSNVSIALAEDTFVFGVGFRLAFSQ